MPLDLDQTSINQYSGVPLHRQLSDLVRAAILDGRLQPEEELPSEPELAAVTGINRTTVRRGLQTLAVEGRIEKGSGKPTRVAARVPVNHMTTERYQRTVDTLRGLKPGEEFPLTSAFVEEHGVDWYQHGVEAAYSEEPATDTDAVRLDLEPLAPVLRRHLIKTVRGQPVQLQESVIPLALVEGTAVQDPNRQPWPGGTIRELWEAGLEVVCVDEVAWSRMPTDDERRRLQMRVQSPVLLIVRTFYAVVGGQERPVEVSLVVCSAAGMELHYRTRLH